MKVTLDIPEALAVWLRQHAGRRSLSHVIVADALPVFRAAVAGELEGAASPPAAHHQGRPPVRDLAKGILTSLAIALVMAAIVCGASWAIDEAGAATYERGRVRGYCEGAGGTVTRSHLGWYCRGADGRVLETP